MKHVRRELKIFKYQIILSIVKLVIIYQAQVLKKSDIDLQKKINLNNFQRDLESMP